MQYNEVKPRNQQNGILIPRLRELKKIAIALFIMVPLCGHGQTSDLGNWLIYIGNKNIGSKWNWHNEVQYRSYDALNDLEQLLLRTGIGYNLTKNNNNLLLGYGFIYNENYVSGLDSKINSNEHRIFQQYIYKKEYRSFSLQHRFRLEQRFIESDFKVRWRYFLGVNIPLKAFDGTNNTLYLSAYNELFLNIGHTVFDRNRVYAGLGYKINSDLRFELGYMNQLLRNGTRDQINVVAYVNL